MNRVSGVLLAVLMFLICAIMTARLFIPLPKFDLDSITYYRYTLEFADSVQARAIKRELANAPSDLARAKVAAIAAGIPLTANEVPPPANEDAYPLYIKWTAMRRARNSPMPLYAEPLTLRWSYTPQQIAVVQKLYDDNRDCDQLLMRAISKPYLTNPPMKIGLSEVPGFEIFSELREAARETTTKADLLALSGKWNGAVNMQNTGFEIVSQAKQQHTIIGYLVSNAVMAITLAGLQNILTHSRPDAEISDKVIKAVKQSSFDGTLKQALIGEASGGIIGTFEEANSTVRNGRATDARMNVMTLDDKRLFDDVADEHEARCLTLMTRAVRAVDEPTGARRVTFAAIDKSLNAQTSAIKHDPTSDLFGGQLWVASFAKKDDELAAKEKILVAGATVLAVKAKTGSFPAQLPGLFPDPFSDGELKYRLKAGGFEIYSVGPSGTFDGGSLVGHGWDSEFVYPAPPSTPVPAEALGTI